MLPSTEPVPPRIFVVDDDEGVRRLLRQVLSTAGYTIEEFGTAEAALDQIRQEPPDLVLLDLRLPDGSGHDVLEAIRADPATRLLPVVMLTGYATRRPNGRAPRPKG